MTILRQSPSGPRVALAGSPVYDNGDSGAAKSIDWSRGASQSIRLTADTTLDLFHGLTEGEAARMSLECTQDATGNHVVVLPFVLTTNAADLVFSTGAEKTDVVDLYWDGHNLFAAFFVKNVTLP